MNRVQKKLAVLWSIAAMGLLVSSSPGLAEKARFSTGSSLGETSSVQMQQQPDEIEVLEASDFVEIVEASDFVELAELALGDRNYYNAIYHANKALDLNSDLPGMYLLRARARKMLGQFEGAIDDLQEAARLYDQDNDREGEAIAKELLLTVQ